MPETTTVVKPVVPLQSQPSQQSSLSVDLVKTKSVLQKMSKDLSVDPEVLQKTLIATVCKPIKLNNGTYRNITTEEFISFIVVANQYHLNPMTKEIYAYPDTKTGGIIPVVSTDGWTKLLTHMPNYKNHRFEYAEKMVNLAGAKPCPEWCECIIEKKDGTELRIREYLDEVFRTVQYNSPWQTHTKRMLRHKTKIQASREFGGLSGIYDQDEAERIIEAQPELKGKPEVQTPKRLSEKKVEPVNPPDNEPKQEKQPETLFPSEDK